MKVLVAPVVSNSCPAHGILQSRILEWVAILSPGDLPVPGKEPGSPQVQADSPPSEPPGKIEVNF